MLPKLQFELMSGKKPEYRMEMLLMFLIMSLKCHVIVGYYGDKHIVMLFMHATQTRNDETSNMWNIDYVYFVFVAFKK